MNSPGILSSIFPPLLREPALGDPVGVSILIYYVVVFLPLFLLVLIGAVAGSIQGGRKGGLSGAFSRGAVGAIVGLVIYLIGYNYLRVGSERMREAKREHRVKQEAAVAACVAQLSTVQAQYSTESIVVESGEIERATLISLLGDQGLKFIELKTGWLDAQSGSAGRWGVRTFGSNVFNGETLADPVYLAEPNVAYLRFSLGRKGEMPCDEQAAKMFGLDRPRAPFAPEACIRVESISEPAATHTIKLRKDAGSKFSSWALVEQGTDKMLFGLATADAPNSPGRENARDARELKQVRFGEVGCRDPYFSMLRTLYRSQAQEPDRLSLRRRIVNAKAAVDLFEDAGWLQARTEVRAEERKINGLEKERAEARLLDTEGADWVVAFQAARNSGWTDLGGDLIDFQAGELISLGNVNINGRWTGRQLRAASRDGFVLVVPYTREGRQDLSLVRFSPDGAVLWQGMVRSRSQHRGLTDFDPASVTWERGEIHIVGSRRTANDEVQTWMFTIPESAIGVVN
jgi:hypothetical protein